MDRAAAAREQSRRDGKPPNEDDDDFIIRLRRSSTHINSYNWITQQAIRSNINFEVILSGTELGGAAAVCKLMGWSDSKMSHGPVLCPERARPTLMLVRHLSRHDIPNACDSLGQ